MNPTPPRVEGCRESLPGISMDVNAHYSIPRFYDKIILGRVLTDAAVERYRRRGRYRARRVVWQQSGNRLVYSA